MKLPFLKDAQVLGKRVLVRADLDVPLREHRAESGELRVEIEDDTRLKAAVPTIEYLLQQGAMVVIGGHVGRPVKKYQVLSSTHQVSEQDKTFSLEPAAQWLAEYFNDVHHYSEKAVDGFLGWEITQNLFLLENLRFYEGEEQNDPEFAKKLASLASIYVNDAFSVSHRNHASVVGVARLLPHYAGFHLEKEIDVLGGVLENPKRPLVVIIGGAKIETKMPLIEKMHGFADYVLVGGKLPQEQAVVTMHDEKVLIADLVAGGRDITDESVGRFKEAINKAAMIVWNGPLGKLEVRSEKLEVTGSEKGTREVAQAIIASSAYKIVGGGDTIDYLQRLGIIDKFDFVSTGGGAMLAFLSGEKLPGLEALLS